MALAIVKRFFSGSTDGLPVEIATTASNSANLHVGPTSTNVLDEIHLFASIDTGATNTADNTITLLINSSCYSLDIPAYAVDYPILSGFPLWGRSASGTVLHVYGSSTAGVFLHGYVNRITET